MNCRAAVRLLPLHAGGDLLADQAADLELHLVGCSSCSGELEAYSELRQVVSSVREPLLHHGLWEALDSRLDAVDATRRLRRRWYRSPWIYSAAAAVLALAFLPPWVPAPDRPSGVGEPGPRSEVAVGADAAAPDLVRTPLLDEAAEVLQQVPAGELERFLRENAGFRQPTGLDGGLVASPVGLRVREF
ncbi:MAG: zf-HC2 domain-containing protein [Planctomycetes bacterium]|nr:zf-HC2 domain-containing protein [Planctomycetota bacterium]MBL7008951.1 zf-HC2 domain-containing protein [Planctomycetota bacterium]